MLQIQPHPSSDALLQQFTLNGVVDIEAITALESLYVLPDNCIVELDFALVQRVNSMGLAQLLKLFEHWQKRSIKTRINNVNRMIGVLFKMTGLTRFLTDDKTASPPVKTAPDIAKPAAQQPAPAPQLPLKAASEKTATSAFYLPPSGLGKLQILPLPSGEDLSQQFALVGTIDVDAVLILQSLYQLPAHCRVQLDFAKVERVNSMGLAQLLKLFENWQKKNISIQIINTSRMIAILFKMTGLTRFLNDENAADTTQDPPPKTNPVNEATKPSEQGIFSEPQPQVNTSPSANNSAKINLLVNAQSSRQMNGWYFFNTYLQRRLGREIHLELTHGAVGEQRIATEHMDMVFTKPFDATRLMLQHGFKGLIRPVDQSDEVTLLVRAEDPRQELVDFKDGKIVTAAQENFVYLLGRFLLEERETALQDMDYLFSGHDIKALQMLLKGSADMLFILSDTYNGLSGLTRKMLREVDQSETAFAFHLFCVAPHLAELGDALSEVLLEMNRDSQGRQVLADLGITGWCQPTPDELDMLTMLFQRYALNAYETERGETNLAATH